MHLAAQADDIYVFRALVEEFGADMTKASRGGSPIAWALSSSASRGFASSRVAEFILQAQRNVLIGHSEITRSTMNVESADTDKVCVRIACVSA